MKKILIICLLLFIGSFCFAEQIVMVQGSWNNTNRKFSSDEFSVSQSYNSAGLNIINFTGRDLGFFTSGSFLFPYESELKLDGISFPATLDMYDFLKTTLEIMIGPGYITRLSENNKLLFAGGFHFNGVALMASPSSFDVEPYLSYVCGVGGNLTYCHELSPSLNLNISFAPAYDFIEIIHMPSIDDDVIKYDGGLTVGISAGFGFSY